MKIFIIIAWRNLWRHRRRSLVVISSIGFGIFSTIFSAAFMNGINGQMIENTISTSLGHVAIHRKGFQDNIKPQYSFNPENKLFEEIAKTRNVVSFAPRVKVQGMIRSSEASRGVMIVGIDPEKEKKVSKIHEYTSKANGSTFLDNTESTEILISKNMAKKLDLLVGDRLVIMIQDRNNRIIGEGLTVRGLYQSPMESIDRFVVFTGIKRLQSISGLGNRLSEITILGKNKESASSIAKDLLKKHNDSDLEILSWEDMAPNLVKAIALYDVMMYIFFSIIFITVIFTVANTLIMAVMERFREIGVMKCVGTKPAGIFFMILFEAINLGIAGLTAGIFSGLILTAILSVTGIDLSAFMESMRMWGTGSIIYPYIRPYDIIMSALIVFFTVVFAALYPAFKAARIKPLKALHYI